MRRKQLHALDHRLLLVIVEPILTWLEAGDDRMPRCRCMPGCMLTRRAVAASDVPALRAPTEMKPPSFRRRQAFHTPITAWLRSGVDSALISLHFDLSPLLTKRLTSPTPWPVDRELCTTRARFVHSRRIISSGSPTLQLDDGIGGAPVLEAHGME
jgi:hypothetical protein